MDAETLSANINASASELKSSTRVKVETIVRVGYWNARVATNWMSGVREPPVELVQILDQEGIPPDENPHVRLLKFVVRKLLEGGNLIPQQRRPASEASIWYEDMAARLETIAGP